MNTPVNPRSIPSTRLLTVLLVLLLLLTALLPGERVTAQDTAPTQPVYVVQPGDTLWDIAIRFRVSVDDLVRANRMADAGQLRIGDHLVIPGLEGIQGILTTVKIGYGESLSGLSRRYRLPASVLARLNRLTSPLELYAGFNLIMPEDTEGEPLDRRASLQPGQSLLELAVLYNRSPVAIMQDNALAGMWNALPGEVLFVPGEPASGPGAFPETVTRLDVNLAELVQGKTAVIDLQAQQPLLVTGTLGSYTLRFFEAGPGRYVALQGLHAMLEPGVYPLSLQAQTDGGEVFGFSQRVYVKSGQYPYEDVLAVDPITLDPAVTGPEEEQWTALIAAVTPERLWTGKFFFPSPAHFYDCWPSTFGRRRSYNGSEYKYFHAGLDVCGSVGNEIYAPAAGVVVYTEQLTVRGNATLVNHGWGVYSGYFHQSEFLVSPGDRIEPGQLIGLVGATGRVNGPHLHWEVWVNGVQVDPLDWLAKEYP